MRDFLPWHVVREKLAARGVVFDDDVPPSNDELSPPSGVRIGEKERGMAAAQAAETADMNAEGLSFKVYTLAELEKRAGEAPPSMRMSMAQAAAQPKASGSSPWLNIGKALVAVFVALRAIKDWAFMGQGRPALKDVVRAPGGVLRAELQAAFEIVDWKRLAITLGFGLGAALFLLFTVLTVAELTDDLKPAGEEGATRMVIPPPKEQPASVTTVTSQPVAVAPAPTVVDELDDVAPAPPPKPVARPAKKPAAKKPAANAKRGAVEVFSP